MKVSVLIPLYNSELHITETINSVLAQTYSNLEIIVVDDGSTDRSFDLVKKIDSPKVKLYSQSNSGASSARNTAYTYSTGEYIQYLDADDLLHPNKIQSQIDKLTKSDGKNVLCSGRWGRFYDSIDNVVWENQEIDKSYDEPYQWLIDSWSGKGMSQPGVFLIPRSLVEKSGEWNENLSLNDDGEFFCRVFLNSSKVVFESNAYVYYRSGNTLSLSNQVSEAALESLIDSISLYKKHFEILSSHSVNNRIFASQLLDLLQSYPQLKNKQIDYIWNLINKWSGKKDLSEIVANRRFGFLNRIISYHNFIKLRNLFKQ